MKIGDTIITIPTTKVGGMYATKALVVRSVTPSKPVVIDTVEISSGSKEVVRESQVLLPKE